MYMNWGKDSRNQGTIWYRDRYRMSHTLSNITRSQVHARAKKDDQLFSRAVPLSTLAARLMCKLMGARRRGGPARLGRLPATQRRLEQRAPLPSIESRVGGGRQTKSASQPECASTRNLYHTQLHIPSSAPPAQERACVRGQAALVHQVQSSTPPPPSPPFSLLSLAVGWPATHTFNQIKINTAWRPRRPRR
jgi:hypothetical protein